MSRTPTKGSKGSRLAPPASRTYGVRERATPQHPTPNTEHPTPNTQHPSPLARRRPVRFALACLGAALLVLAAWRPLYHRPPAMPAAPAWDRPESPEEGRLLAAALARPSDGEAQLALGRYYLGARRPFEALWIVQRARQATGDRVDVLMALADALEAGGLRQRALDLLTEVTAHRPGDPTLTERRAELQLRLGRPTAALQSLRALSSATPTTRSTPIAGKGAPNTSLFLGRVLEAAGEDQAAVAQYRRGVASRSLEAQVRLGNLLVRLGQVKMGRAELESAHRLAPADPRPCYALGMSFWPEIWKRPEPAARWFQEALKASPGYEPAHVALGRMAVKHRLWKLAAPRLEQAQRLNPQDPEPPLVLAELLAATGYREEAPERRGLADVMQGKLPQALSEFQAAKAAAPGSRDASILISQALIQMERSPVAAAEIRSIADRFPRDGELQARLAQLYIDALSRDAARHVCEAWLRVDPHAAKPHWLLGRIAALSARQRLDAIDQYEQALRLAPDDPEIVSALGEALSQRGPRQDTGRALDLLGRAVDRAPEASHYRYQLGLLLQQLQRPESARRQFLRALDLDPNMTAAAMNLIQLAGQLHEPGQVGLLAPVIREQQEAKRVDPPLRRRVYQSPADPAVYADLARYLAQRGDLQPARAQWEVVAALRPGDREAQRELARLDRILDVL